MESGHGARTSQVEADRAITAHIEVLPSASNKMHIIARVRSNAGNNIVQPRGDTIQPNIFISRVRGRAVRVR